MASASGGAGAPRPYGVLRYPGRNFAFYGGRAVAIDTVGGTVLVHDGAMQKTVKVKRVKLASVEWGAIYEPDNLTPVCVRKALMTQALNGVQSALGEARSLVRVQLRTALFSLEVMAQKPGAQRMYDGFTAKELRAATMQDVDDVTTALERLMAAEAMDASGRAGMRGTAPSPRHSQHPDSKEVAQTYWLLDRVVAYHLNAALLADPRTAPGFGVLATSPGAEYVPLYEAAMRTYRLSPAHALPGSPDGFAVALCAIDYGGAELLAATGVSRASLPPWIAPALAWMPLSPEDNWEAWPFHDGLSLDAFAARRLKALPPAEAEAEAATAASAGAPPSWALPPASAAPAGASPSPRARQGRGWAGSGNAAAAAAEPVGAEVERGGGSGKAGGGSGGEEPPSKKKQRLAATAAAAAAPAAAAVPAPLPPGGRLPTSYVIQKLAESRAAAAVKAAVAAREERRQAVRQAAAATAAKDAWRKEAEEGGAGEDAAARAAVAMAAAAAAAAAQPALLLGAPAEATAAARVARHAQPAEVVTAGAAAATAAAAPPAADQETAEPVAEEEETRRSLKRLREPDDALTAPSPSTRAGEPADDTAMAVDPVESAEVEEGRTSLSSAALAAAAAAEGAATQPLEAAEEGALGEAGAEVETGVEAAAAFQAAAVEPAFDSLAEEAGREATPPHGASDVFLAPAPDAHRVGYEAGGDAAPSHACASGDGCGTPDADMGVHDGGGCDAGVGQAEAPAAAVEVCEDSGSEEARTIAPAAHVDAASVGSGGDEEGSVEEFGGAGDTEAASGSSGDAEAAPGSHGVTPPLIPDASQATPAVLQTMPQSQPLLLPQPQLPPEQQQCVQSPSLDVQPPALEQDVTSTGSSDGIVEAAVSPEAAIPEAAASDGGLTPPSIAPLHSAAPSVPPSPGVEGEDATFDV